MSTTTKLLTSIFILLVAFSPARAQVITNVSTAAELATALNQSFLYSQEFGTLLTNRITLTGNISANTQMIVNADVIIDGAGFSIDMNNADRAFFIAGGNVAINNLTIQNGNATGGDAVGGGGGAGLGGAIFVGSGTYNGGFDPMTGTNPVFTGVSVPNVTLAGVSFVNNAAVGGSSGTDATSTSGGGMGGAGVVSGGESGGGGGGFGVGANGGAESQAGGAGAFVNIAGTNTSGGAGGNGGDTDGGAGGANGGGGGGGGETSFFGQPGSGGGGGLGGARGFFANNDPPNNGGNGGFGGGGGQAAGSYGSGGNGGFGGGGGSAYSSGSSGGNGGFGGGGGSGFGAAGLGGFGAADATSPGSTGNDSNGGGGLGAGGAIFVMAGALLTVDGGSFSGNSVVAGTGGEGNNGSAYGVDLFLGANVTFNVSSNLTVNSLGGAGNLADPNVANHANDPNAQGGIIKTGAGNLTLAGTNYYTGATTVSAGRLTVNGSIATNSAVTVQSSASLGGSGSVGAIGGAGSIDPGNSPGILTATSVDPSGGLTFNYEFTGLNPDFSNANASVNDLLRLTDATPFTLALNNANAVNIYFNLSDLGAGLYTGGFFTDTQSDFLSQIVNATFTYYLADELGAVSYNGVNYRALDAGYTMTVSTAAESANFGGGTVNGQVMQVQVVPEPSTYALLALAGVVLGYGAWCRRVRRAS